MEDKQMKTGKRQHSENGCLKSRSLEGKDSGRKAAGFCTALLLAACVVLSGCGGGGESTGARKQQSSTSAGVDDVLQAGVEEYDSTEKDEADGTQAASQPGGGADNDVDGSAGAVPVQASEGNDVSAGSGDETTDGTAEDGDIASGEVDVDLTALSSTIVYSEVFNMMSNPDDYIGKTVRMEGPCAIYYDEPSGIYYYACIIQDATACCAQGMEFELNETYDRPEDYPEEGEEVIVEGTFDTYMENGYLYCTLRDGRLIDG